MRIYFDTEFTTLDALADCELISAGFIAEDGREWYAELTDFHRSSCSPFAELHVLPLLGGQEAQRMTTEEFPTRLAAWLASFETEIDLVTDFAGDWFLLNDYARSQFKALPHEVRGRVWQRSEQPGVQAALWDAESVFWQSHPGKQHHALYDARRLKVLAERQAALLHALKESEK